MTTIGDVAVKLGLDSKDFMKNIDKVESECKELEQGLNETKESFEKMSKAMAMTKNPSKEMVKVFDDLKNTLKNEQSAFNDFQSKLNKFDGGLTKSSSAVGMLQGALSKLLTAGAIITLGKQMIDFSAKSVNAFREQDRAIKVLNTSLTNAGVYTSNYSNHLQKLSEELQSVTNYGDEAIARAIGLGQAYSGNIKLTDDLIKATVDYAAATETDLQTAFTLVGKSIGTSTNALARYGVNLDDSMSKEQKMAVITETLAQRFSGSANDMADKSTQLKNAVGDLSEEIGGVLNPAVEACQTVLINFVNWLKESIKSIRAFLDEAAIATSTANQKMASGMQKEAQYYRSLAEKEMKRAEELRAKGQTTRADAVQRRAESYLKHAKEFDEASERRLQHAQELQKKEEAITQRNNKFAGTRSSFTSSPSKRVEEAKKEIDEYEKLKDRIKSYQENIANLNIENSIGPEGAFLSGLSSQYKARLDLEIWYQEEKRKIIEESNGNLQMQQDAFAQLDTLKNAQLAQTELGIWEKFGSGLSSVMTNTFTSLLSGQESFGDALKNMASSLLSQMLQMLIQYVMRELAIRALSMFLGGGAGAAAGGALSSVATAIPAHHSGGMIPGTKEQLAVLQGGERVLNRSEAENYNNNDGSSGESGVNNIMVFNIKAWDGKDVINTLKANEQTINQIVSSGIKNNKQGLRTVVQNT